MQSAKHDPTMIAIFEKIGCNTPEHRSLLLCIPPIERICQYLESIARDRLLSAIPSEVLEAVDKTFQRRWAPNQETQCL